MGGKLSYANVMSTLAVFLALAGGSFAIGAALSKNSVKSRQVKNESLTNKDLKNGKAVGADEVIDESLGASEIGAAAVGSSEIADGSVGAADLAADESVHVVGAAGEPALGNGGQNDCLWTDINAVLTGEISPVSFYKGKGGRVYLGGIAASNNGPGGDAACDNTPVGEVIEDTRMFTLPPGYRPPHVVLVPATDGTNTTTLVIGADHDAAFQLSFLPAGSVTIYSAPGPYPGGVNIEGVSFRAAG